MNRTRRDVRNAVGKFARYSEINSFIDQVVADSPNIASSYIAGTTHENRVIKAIVFKTATSNRGIFIDCGFHAVSKLIKFKQKKNTILISFSQKSKIKVKSLIFKV